MKLIFLLLLLPLLLGNGALQFISNPNENQTIFFNCLVENNFVSSEANVTIYYPNKSIFIVDNPLSSYETGKFSYDFITPSVLGVYEVQFICEELQNNTKGVATGGFQIKNIEDEVMGIFPITFALIAIMAGLWYLSYAIGNKKHRYPEKTNKWILKVTNPQLISVLLNIMGIWIIPILLYLFAINNENVAIYTTLFIVSIILVAMFTFLYLILYLLFKMYVVMWEDKDSWANPRNND